MKNHKRLLENHGSHKIMIARNENLGNHSKLCKNMEVDRTLKHEEHDIDKC